MYSVKKKRPTKRDISYYVISIIWKYLVLYPLLSRYLFSFYSKVCISYIFIFICWSTFSYHKDFTEIFVCMVLWYLACLSKKTVFCIVNSVDFCTEYRTKFPTENWAGNFRHKKTESYFFVLKNETHNRCLTCFKDCR